jgi:hypothetical protein
MFLQFPEPPMTTLNQIKDFDPKTQAIIAYCGECRHSATLNLELLQSELTVPDLRRRLRCTECGTREAEIRIGYIAAGGFRYS